LVAGNPKTGFTVTLEHVIQRTKENEIWRESKNQIRKVISYISCLGKSIHSIMESRNNEARMPQQINAFVSGMKKACKKE
jgi:hypothetical protein